MASNGFYKWAIDGDAAGGSAPEDASIDQTSPADDAPSLSVQKRAEDLNFEKKRLQLAGLDPEKFDYFFDTYYDQIFNFAYWRTADHDQAADIAAEVFMRAWDRRGQFRWQGYSFGAWLFQIARRVLSHQYRRQQVRKETEYVPEHHERVDDTTPADVLDQKTDQELVRMCLEQLAADPHEVIVLHHFMGLTTREIALITKIPLGTVNSHLRRGKQVLRRCLEEHGAANGLSETAQRIVRQSAIEDSGLNIVDNPDED